MKIPTFELERYFAKHEFSARYLLSSSDCESLSLLEIIELADKEKIHLWVDLKLGYTESAGHPLLREEIAKEYQRVMADDVLVLVPEEGIFLLMHSLLGPGDHVVCTFPGYQSLYDIARSIGCEVSFWQPEEKLGWDFKLSRLQGLLQPNTKLVVVNFPHNPTGYVPSEEEYRKLIELVANRGIHLLSDEMYRHLEIAPVSTLPAGCDLYERAHSLSGLSKSYGLPGLRIGWVASRDEEMLRRMAKLRDYTTICASAPSEILAIYALQNREIIIREQLERLYRNLDLLDAFFGEYDDCLSWSRPKGGSVGFPRLLISGGATDFCDRLVRKTGIMLVPSSVFQFGDSHVRFGFGRENLPVVIDVFKSYLDHLYR